MAENSTHTGTFSTRERQHRKIGYFAALCVTIGAVGGFTGANENIMTALIYGGFGLLGGIAGINTFGKIKHDEQAKGTAIP